VLEQFFKQVNIIELFIFKFLLIENSDIKPCQVELGYNSPGFPSYCLTPTCEFGKFYLMDECIGNSLTLNYSHNLDCQEGCPDCTSNYCHQCQDGYSGDNGQCTLLCPSVENCDICETSTTCHTCEDQSYLSNDKTECTSNFIAINKLFTIEQRLWRSEKKLCSLRKSRCLSRMCSWVLLG